MLRFALIFWRVLASRAVRVLIYLWILLWGADRAIFWITEAAWFGSVGQSQWFGARFLAQFGLFWGAFFLFLVSGAAAMRVAARPLPQTPDATLPRALERLEPLRRGAARLAWLILIVGAWSVARQIAGAWPLVLAALSGAPAEFGVVWQLQLAQLLGASGWEWLLVLLGASAFVGVLRALPLLARREPIAPVKLWRMLGVLGALALGVRGANYGINSAAALASHGAGGGEFWIGVPLAVVGALLCLVAAAWCLRRPGIKRLGVAVVLAVFLPRVAGALLSPLRLVLAPPPGVAARQIAATRAGWGLDAIPAIDRAAPPLSSHWPIWNEQALLGVARGKHGRFKGQVTDWRAAFHQGTLGLVVGVPAALENWGSRHEAESESALLWLALDAAKNVEGSAPEIAQSPLPLRSFYGLEGHPLAGNAPLTAGVPFGNWGWKVAWVWRLRDPLLLLDGARAGRLLVFRGARESVERLAPFLVWDEPRLRFAPAGAKWEVVGYATTAHFRGARAMNEGEFAGFNAAAPAVRAEVDPANGRVEFFAVAPTANAPTAPAQTARAQIAPAPAQTAPVPSVPTADAPTADAPATSAPATSAPATSAPATSAPATSATSANVPTPKWGAGWARVLGAQSAIDAPGETPLLARARAEMARQMGEKVLGEPVWTWSGGRGQYLWRASNLPPGIEAHLAALDAEARRNWNVGREGVTLELGDALLWPDAKAPGGFWVGRPYYSSAAVGGGALRQTRLWRVGLTSHRQRCACGCGRRRARGAVGVRPRKRARPNARRSGERGRSGVGLGSPARSRRRAKGGGQLEMGRMGHAFGARTALARRVGGAPERASGRAVRFGDAPNDAPAPENSAKMPWNGATIPRNGTSVPRRGASVPRRGTSVPRRGTSVPWRGASVPRRGASVKLPGRMRLTSSEVEHIALLSRLELSDAERERAANELSQIIGYFEALSELDTDEVEPTMHALPLENVLRADEVRAGLSREAALMNAPESADGMFQVPRVVEAE